MPTPPRNVLPWQAQSARHRVPLILVRHGQTAWNLEGRFLGQSDIPLDATGLDQAARVGAWLSDLPAQAIVSSPLSRASQTADAISRAAGHPPPILDPRLAELDQGELEGHPGRTLPERWPEFFARWVSDPADARVPGGETLRECRDRGMAALSEHVATASTDTPLVVVSHKMLISTVICTILGLPLAHYRRIGQGNTAVNLLSHGADGFALHLLNATPHLDGEGA